RPTAGLEGFSCVPTVASGMVAAPPGASGASGSGGSPRPPAGDDPTVERSGAPGASAPAEPPDGPAGGAAAAVAEVAAVATAAAAAAREPAAPSEEAGEDSRPGVPSEPGASWPLTGAAMEAARSVAAWAPAACMEDAWAAAACAASCVGRRTGRLPAAARGSARSRRRRSCDAPEARGRGVLEAVAFGVAHDFLHVALGFRVGRDAAVLRDRSGARVVGGQRVGRVAAETGHHLGEV